MQDYELKALLDTQLNNAINGYITQEDDDLPDALDYYYARPFGNEEYGHSTVVTREVFEAVEWALPDLVRVFVGGEQVVEFDPVSQQDEAQAQEETDTVNHIFLRKNNGFLIVYDWLKDALLQRNGYVKVYWDEFDEVKTEVIEGLSDFDLVQLEEQDDIEIVEHTETSLMQMDDFGMVQEVTTHDVKIKITNRVGKIQIDNCPPEEIRIARNARSISPDEADFVAHKSIKTVSKLIDMGFDPEIVKTIPKDQRNESDLDHYRSITDYSEEDLHTETDDTMKEVELNECYVWVDYDGDGEAEYRQIFMAGNHILSNEEIDYCPIEALTPVRMPHKHIGMSQADKVMDIQLIKSTLLRQMLDNLYLTNNPQKEVVEDLVEMDDLLTSEPGGVVRVEEAGAVREMTVPFTAGESGPMLDLLDNMKEMRTGVSRHATGMDADVLAQSTKGAFMGALDKANAPMELMARLFAETGFKNLFKKIHFLLRKHQEEPMEIKLSGKWKKVNPSEWVERDDLNVSVGLGTASKDSVIQRLMAVIQEQKDNMLNGSPLVTHKNMYNAYEKLLEAADMRGEFFTNPETLQPKQPQPDPNQIMMQMQKQMLEMQEQTKRMKIDSDARLKQMELMLKGRKQEHDEDMDKAHEGLERAKVELQYDEEVPGSIV